MAIDKNKVAFVFPGQGSQVVTMGQDICMSEADAKNTFRLVNEQCDFDLTKVAWVGPEEALKRTLHAQPALFATSAACMQALRGHWGHDPLCVAGHSLGEFSALWAAGAFNIQDGAKLTSQRALLMETAPSGSMAAVLGYDQTELETLCTEQGIVIANYNTPQQQVISGDKDKVIATCEILKERKVKAIILPVSGAFHSSLVQEANNKFQDVIKSVEFKNTNIPVIQNTTAKAHTQASELQGNLLNQMTSSVYWTQSIETMVSMGAETFIEIGSGKVLSGLIKKIDRSLNTLQVSDTASLKATLEILN